LARIIARQLERPFYTLSAVTSGVKDVRDVIDKAKRHAASSNGLFGAQQEEVDRRAVLFIDEIHRFSKSQQDSLLGAVEDGTITLIGATTENPSFEVITPLLSRCQVYVLKSLTRDDLLQLLQRVLTEDEYIRNLNVEIKETDSILRYSGGDARKLLNIIELVTNSGTRIIDNETVTKQL
jgi:putative ATPase